MIEKKVSDNNICDKINIHQTNEITTQQIDLLFLYYNLHTYKDFISDINKLRFHKIKVDIPFVKNKVINKLKSDTQYQNFILSNTIIPKVFISQSK